MKRTCIFCGKDDLTKEHVLPKWLQKYFGPAAGGLHVISKRDSDPITFNDKAFARTARIVCGGCNSGWMSLLEAETEKLLGPLVTGPGIGGTLSLEQQAILARWAAKTLIVLEYAGNEKDNHIPIVIPNRLYSLHALLPELTIYMGFRKEAYGEGGKHAAGYVVQSPTTVMCKPEHRKLMRVTKTDEKKIFSVALVLGHVYFYMLGTDIPDGYVFLHPKEDQYLTELWPNHPEGSIVWPNTSPIELKGNWDEITTELNKKTAIDFYKT